MAKINPMAVTDHIYLWLQIGKLNSYGYDRMRMDQDLPYTYEGQFCTQLTTANINILDETGYNFSYILLTILTLS